MSNAVAIGCTIGLGVYVVGMIALLQLQWHRLKCSDTDTALTAGLARTVADLLTETTQPAQIAALVERDRFRSVKVCAFAPNGDVLLDSASPCATKDLRPTTASARQTELFRAIHGAEDRKTGVAGQVVTGTLYRTCHPSGSGDPQLTTFSSLRTSGDVLVAATSCGHED
jgi:hypothetical protein